MRKRTSAVTALLLGAMLGGAFSAQSHSEEPTGQQTEPDNKQGEFETLDDRYSYAYGIELAEKFKAEGIEFNVDLLAAAMHDVYSNGERRMPDGEVAATMEIYQEIYTKKKEAERAAIGEKNRKEGEEFLTANASKDGVIVTDSGLQYKVINEGDSEYKPAEDDLVTVHYRGTFVDGTEFDSTYERNEPYVTRVNKLIDGWTEALQLMTEGSRWELYIPAELAYGEQGSEPYVGPNATLVFEVELLEIEKSEDEKKS